MSGETRGPSVIALLINFRDSVRSIRCIWSLIAEGVSVVVWDNSSDGGVSAAQIDNTFAHFEDVEIIVSPKNLGFAAGMNQALRICGEIDANAWALIINNDAIVRPGGIQRLKDALIGNPHAVLSFPNICHSGAVSGPSYYLRTLGLIFSRPGWGRFMYPSGCCLLLANDRFTTQWFDEDFFMYGEDCELGWRLKGNKAAMIHVPETLVDHEGSASSVVGSIFYETRMCAAHWLLGDKLSLNRFDKVVLYFGRVISLLSRATVRSIRYRSINPWVGLRAGTILALGLKRGGKKRGG